MICKIERVNFRGEGVGISSEGKRYRVANALTGETLQVVDVSLPRRSMALLCDVLTPSPERQTPPCPQWAYCGACQYQCLSLQRQADLKFEHWSRLIGKFVDIAQDCERQYHRARRASAYRHRAEGKLYDGLISMSVRRDVLAYHAILESDAQSQDIDTSKSPRTDIQRANFAAERLSCTLGKTIPKAIPLVACPHHADELKNLIERTQDQLNRLAPIDPRLSFGFEAYETNARLTVFAQAGAESLSQELSQSLSNDLELNVVCQNLPPKGSHVYPKPIVYGTTPYYCYTKDISASSVSALSGAWTPVNPPNAALIADCLAQNLKDFANNCNTALEIGCGCGTHAGLFPSRIKYHGIDASWPAIRSANYNAEQNAWENKTFQSSTAKHYLEKNYYKGARADLIVLHSNRLPYGDGIAQWCKKLGAKHIFIVAPTAYALAKECQCLSSEGYKMKRLSFCDTMPRTYHMMGVAVLSLET